MDYTINPSKYLINEGKDNHLLAGKPIDAKEGMIAILKKCDETKYSHQSIVLYHDATQDTDANKAWCTKVVDDEGTTTYTLVATMPINEAVVAGAKVYAGGVEYGTIYFVGDEGKDWYEFTLQYIEQHVFVERGAGVTQELLDTVEQLVEDSSTKYAVIAGPATMKEATPDAWPVTWDDAAYKNRVAIYAYSAEVVDQDGKKATTITATTSNETIDGCDVTINGFTGGVYQVKTYLEWKDPDSGATRKISAKSKITDWIYAPVIVEDSMTYETLKAYDMLISPSVEDPTNFANAHDLTKTQMINPEALAVLKTANLAPQTSGIYYDKKVNYLKAMGETEADAQAMAMKFIILDEVVTITETQLGTKFQSNTSLTHFEALGYFIGLINIPQQAFNSCSNLTVVYLPTNIVVLGIMAFNLCTALTTIQTLED